jgi:hypothetical protein
MWTAIITIAVLVSLVFIAAIGIAAYHAYKINNADH